MSRSNMRVIPALVGAVVMLGSATAAFAGADDGNVKAFFMPGAGEMHSVQQPASRADDYRATYYRPEAESRATSDAASSQPQKDPPAYYHAEGTMGVP